MDDAPKKKGETTASRKWQSWQVRKAYRQFFPVSAKIKGKTPFLNAVKVEGEHPAVSAAKKLLIVMIQKGKYIGWKYVRECKGCGFSYWTVEVAVWNNWPAGVSSVCCPDHPHATGATVSCHNTDLMAKMRQLSEARVKAMTIGGVYRRRACRVPVVDPKTFELVPCNKRWTTVEITPVDDIHPAHLCPQCGQRANLRRDTMPPRAPVPGKRQVRQYKRAVNPKYNAEVGSLWDSIIEEGMSRLEDGAIQFHPLVNEEDHLL